MGHGMVNGHLERALGLCWTEVSLDRESSQRKPILLQQQHCHHYLCHKTYYHFVDTNQKLSKQSKETEYASTGAKRNEEEDKSELTRLKALRSKRKAAMLRCHFTENCMAGGHRDHPIQRMRGLNGRKICFPKSTFPPVLHPCFCSISLMASAFGA